MRHGVKLSPPITTVFAIAPSRPTNYKWIIDFCSVDSIMLLEEGFDVVSVDASDKMLKYALKERWNRRTEPAFNNWGKRPMGIWIIAVLLMWSGYFDGQKRSPGGSH